MSTAASSSTTNYFGTLGLGYSIVIALGFLVLLSIILLASYICCRATRRRATTIPISTTASPITTSDGGIILPRILFVPDGEDDNAVVGLDQSVINSYPRFQYSKDAGYGNGSDGSCSICLCDYKEMEVMRMMPECRHFFHLPCLDAWLKLNCSCPVCRNSPLPTPLSTPLSEVVPLSQYAADRRRSRR